ncbi:unnamed protein product, partial [Didymodactylos carnosus]
TSTRKKNDDEKDETNVGKLYFLNRQNLQEDICHLQVSDNASVIRTLWSPKLNQIFCTTSDGIVKIYYDPVRSRNGALSFANREPRK